MNWRRVIPYFDMSPAELMEDLEDRGGHPEPELTREVWRQEGTDLDYWTWLRNRIGQIQDELDADNPYA